MNYKKTFLLGFGFFAILLTWTLYNALIPLILGNFIKSEAIIGFVMTIDNYLALFLIPTIGFYSDRINTKFGKRMPFIMVGMPLAALFIFLLPNYINLGTLMICIIGMNLSMALYRSPVISLMPDITAVEYRSKANSIINFVGGIGAVIATVFGGLLFEKNEAYPFYIASSLILFSFIILYVNIKEKRDVIDYEEQEESESIFKGLKEGFKRKEVILILLAICSWFIAYNGIETFFTRYATEYLNVNKAQATFTLTFMSLPFLIFALPAGIIGTKLGKKLTMLIGLLGVLLTMPFLIYYKDILIIQICFAVIGISWALVNINSFPFVTNLSPVGKIGMYTGLYYLFSSIANIISPPLLGFVIDLTSFGSLFIYSSIFFLISFVLLTFVKVGKEI